MLASAISRPSPSLDPFSIGKGLMPRATIPA